LTGAVTISGSATTDLVRITQTGTGNALVVEDSTNPDATPFVVDAGGNVGIGIATPAASLDVSANTSGDAVRITQVGTGNALVVEDSANPDSTPLVVDADGRLIVGTTTSQNNIFRLQSIGTNGGDLLLQRWPGASSGGTFIRANKSRGAAIGTRGIVSSGDTIATFSFEGDDGSAFIQAATIIAGVDGTPGLSDMPGRLVFSTTADGASTPTERMRITNAGFVGINQTSPGSTLDVKGTLRLSGSTSGYVGLAPAAAAGSVTYTLPSTDGTTGQFLSTNGSGTLSWSTASSGTTTGINFQSFTSTGTWTKPAGYAAGSRAFIQVWGGGGGGAKNASNSNAGSGGGGGGYSEIWVTLSALGATETVTIGAGGTAGGGTGGAGGNTTFGSILTGYGGGGGYGNNAAAGGGGGGGGQLSAGTTATNSTGAAAGQPWQNDGGTCSGVAMSQGGGGGVAPGGHGFWAGGGGGGAGSSGQSGAVGGKSYYGGGGGGGGGAVTGGGAGGISVVGGAGGAGTLNTTATAGSQPGGGGGGTYSGTAAAGGAGEVRITVFPA
jgi:hypothetical protein